MTVNIDGYGWDISSSCLVLAMFSDNQVSRETRTARFFWMKMRSPELKPSIFTRRTQVAGALRHLFKEPGDGEELESRYDCFLSQCMRFSVFYGVLGWGFILILIEHMKLDFFSWYARPICIFYLVTNLSNVVFPEAKIFKKVLNIERMTFLGYLLTIGLLSGYTFFSFTFFPELAKNFGEVVKGSVYVPFEKLPEIYDLHDQLTSLVILEVSVFLNLILAPFRLRKMCLITCAYAIMVGIAYSQVPGTWELFTGLAMVTGLLIRITLLGFKRKELRQVIRAEKIIADQAEAMIAHEMQLAHDIQMSTKLPDDSIWNGYRVRSYLVPHKKVGGDWSSIHVLRNGDLVVAVVDSSGKGMHAALVTHAVQSLWAMETSKAEFDPESWLRTVNETLVLLGRHTSHTATIGILQVSEKEISYWSAGHCPVFIFQKGTDGICRHIYGKGDLLGFSSDFSIRKIVEPLEDDKGILVFLCSDGIYEHVPKSTAKRRLFFDKIDTDFFQAIRALPASDDMTAILIAKDRVAKTKAA